MINGVLPGLLGLFGLLWQKFLLTLVRIPLVILRLGARILPVIIIESTISTLNATIYTYDLLLLVKVSHKRLKLEDLLLDGRCYL